MAQTTCFASFGPIFLSVACWQSLVASLASQWLLVCKNHDEKKKKTHQMTQMTWLTSFGPILHAATFPEPLHNFNISIVASIMFSINKKTQREK